MKEQTIRLSLAPGEGDLELPCKSASGSPTAAAAQRVSHQGRGGPGWRWPRCRSALFSVTLASGGAGAACLSLNTYPVCQWRAMALLIPLLLIQGTAAS